MRKGVEGGEGAQLEAGEQAREESTQRSSGGMGWACLENTRRCVCPEHSGRGERPPPFSPKWI